MADEAELREYLRRAVTDLSRTRRDLADVRHAAHEPIAITGMSCRFPGGADGPDHYWDLLRRGADVVADVPRERFDLAAFADRDPGAAARVYTRAAALLDDVAGWDADFFGVPPREALRMDPAQRLVMELVWELLEDAGIPPTSLAGSRTAVVLGLMDTQGYARVQVDAAGPDVAGDPFFGQGLSPSVLAGRVAHHFDLRGPALTIDTACSSSLVAVHLAVQALRRGECDLAVAGGAFVLATADTHVQTCATSQLSPLGRGRTFDRAADGYVLGEGAGLVLLERTSAARRNRRRVLGLVLGSATNQDGRSNGLTAPSRSAQVAVVRAALDDARVEPDAVGYVEAHGSGTALGDAIELGALHDVFGGRSRVGPLAVGAVKTNIGHTQSAAGIAGLIKAVLTLDRETLVPNLGLSDPCDAVPGDGSLFPIREASPFPTGPARLAGVSSFGWSGTNAHVVVGPAPEAEPRHLPTVPLPLLVSAADPAALRTQLTRLAAWVTAHPETPLLDLAHTLVTGRAVHDVRWGTVVTDRDEAARALTAAAADHDSPRLSGSPRVAFLLPGVGEEYPRLGAGLLRSDAVFAAVVGDCRNHLQDLGVELGPWLDRDPGTGRRPGDPFAGAAAASGTALRDIATGEVADTATVHAYVFTVEYALARSLMGRGVQPDVLLGYSLGEYVAACLAGVLDLPDALHVVVERGRLLAGTGRGAMLAVAADEAVVREAIRATGDEVDVAAVNGPDMTVASGISEGIDALAQRLAGDGVPAVRMRTDHAFHSRLSAPARDGLAAVLAAVDLRPPRLPVVSNRTGLPLTAAEATTVDHWVSHLVEPVRFAGGVASCRATGVDTFVEVGPGQTLGGLVHRSLGHDPVRVLATLPGLHDAARGDPTHDEATRVLATCVRLWEAGIAIDMTAAAPGGRPVAAPTYPFQRTRFWPRTDGPAVTPLQRSVVDEKPRNQAFTITWRRELDPASLPPDRDPDPLVLVADRGGVAGRLASLAETAGARVVVVDPDSDPEATARAAASAPADRTLRVAFLRGLDADRPTASISESYLPLLRTVQAVGDRAGGVRLLTVSRGGSEVLGDDARGPATVAGHGLGRVARVEYAGLDWDGLDLDPDVADVTDDAAWVAAELDRPRGGTVVAVRRGRRWVPEWTPLDTTPEATSPGGAGIPSTSAGEPPVWRVGGTYLVIGGARGLGRVLARRLVGLGVTRLALVGRTATRHDTADLTTAGAEVLALDADASSPDQLRAAIGQCREHFGALDGLVHAAGLPASGMLRRQAPDGVLATMAAKVNALEVIGEELDRPDPPELVVLYSSAVTVLGAIGEADYCAANTVLDAYGAALDARYPRTRVRTIAWGPWQHDAWQSPAAGPGNALAERAGDVRRRYGFTDEQGCTLLDDVIGAGPATVIAVRHTLEQARREWTELLDLDGLVMRSSASGQRFPRPQLRVEYVAPRSRTERMVAEAWQEYLGIETVGADDPFFDLGGNSLVGLAMIRALEQRLGTTIPPALLFEHPTVADLSQVLDTAVDTAVDTAASVDAGADRGRRRRVARTSRRGPTT
ncbi:MAG: SDR family NAD(P)-dependent oxidoreductase [Kineosporiaceae bacterium]